VDGA
jgi:hypothetical protein